MAKTKTMKPGIDFCEDCGESMEGCVCIEDIEETPMTDDDLNIEQDISTTDLDDNENMPDNPMGLAYQISKESDVVKQFVELPREVKFSFYDTNEKLEVKHFSRTYRDWQYIEKILDLRVEEDNNKYNSRDDLKKINSKEDLKQYFVKTNREYLINDLDDLAPEDLEKLITHLKIVKANEFMNSIEKRKETMETIYDNYALTNEIPEYVDDAGMLGKIMDTSLASMGYKGNAAQHSVMTINAVKNEDIQRSAEEKTKFSFLDSIKKRFG